MDEYTMSWSDALRTEAAFLAIDATPPPAEDLHQFGTLGQALWKERCLAGLRQLRSSGQDVRNRRTTAEIARL